ncbi:MAG: hypothetical protein ACW97Z_13945 [Candidatus Hodarchaeales archaeon]|jgi:hypothetical protein
MVPSPQQQLDFNQIRQNTVGQHVEPLVLDFLEIWWNIHSDAASLSMKDIPEYARSLLQSFTLPLYNQYKNTKLFHKYDAWIKDFSALGISWRNGVIMFPLRLITYEVNSHQDQLLEYYINRLQTGQLQGTQKELFDFLFPRLIIASVPLKSVDILLMKSLLEADQGNFNYFKGLELIAQAKLTNTSVRTVKRRMKLLNFSQIPIPVYFLDMAALGYETYIISHFNKIPEKISPWVLHSIDLTISQFSLLQLPLRNPRLYKNVEDQLEPLIFSPLSERIHSWNLSGLDEGKDAWKTPPSFVHTYPTRDLATPSPHLRMLLQPQFDRFRDLTSPDIKLIEFITTQGTVSSVKKLSRILRMTVPDITEKMKEFQQQRLILRTIQFFNIGLDLSLFFFISAPKSVDIDWATLFTTFAKVDVFYDTSTDVDLYFGFLKLPVKFYKDFTQKVAAVKKEFPDIKFYYTVEPADITRWNLSLSDTYSG